MTYGPSPAELLGAQSKKSKQVLRPLIAALRPGPNRHLKRHPIPGSRLVLPILSCICMPSPLPLHLRRLVELHQDAPASPLAVIVPRPQLAAAVRDALHRRRQARTGLHTTTVRDLARRLARIHPAAPKKSPVSRTTIRSLLLDTLNGLDESVRSEIGIGGSLRHVVGSMASVIQELRANDVSPATLYALAPGRPLSASRRALAVGYEAYDRYLLEHDAYDIADVFGWATAQVRTHRARWITDATVALYDDVELTGCEAAFLRALRDEARRFTRLGAPIPDAEAPPATAAAHFDASTGPRSTGLRSTDTESTSRPKGLSTSTEDATGAPSPDADHAAPQTSELLRGNGSVRFREAIGTDREVRWVFEDILDRGLPLDDVEIAFPPGAPYRSFLTSTAEALDLPVTLSTGRPVLATRPGQALDRFYEWMQSGLDAEILIHMLRGGLLRLDRLESLDPLDPDDGPSDESLEHHDEPAQNHNPEQNDSLGPNDRTGQDDEHGLLPAHRAATLLARRRYESGRRGDAGDRGGFTKAFTTWTARLEREIRRRRAAGAEATAQERTHAEVRQLAVAVDALRDLVPERRTTVADLAARSLQFLAIFGPTDRPDASVPDTARGRDEAATAVLASRLERLARVDDGITLPSREAIQLLRSSITEDFVQALRPLPGRAHVVPLSSAGFAGRSHLYVVGMDANHLAVPETPDALLADEDRDRLSEMTGVQLPRAEADQGTWEVTQALWRHEGPVTFLSSVYDVEKGEDVFPSALFTQLRRAYGSNTRADVPRLRLRPDAASTPVDNRSFWVGNETASEEAPAYPRPSRALAAAMYPWCADGRRAEQARASTEYTAYDGLLAPRTYDELDLLQQQKPLSATQIQTLAGAPYAYFLKYVLGVEPLSEPALDAEGWLDIRDYGTLLHDTFEDFMEEIHPRRPTPDDASLLVRVLDRQLDAKSDELAPPSAPVEAATRSRLREDARVFLRAEVEHAADYAPVAFERGFGLPPHRQKVDDIGRVAINVGNGIRVPVQGRIDRVDRRADGDLAIWDYKTGSQKHFDATDPLQHGRTIQWALYAYALEQGMDVRVAESGYFFTSVREMGARLAFDPSTARTAVGDILTQLAACTRTGAFMQSPRLHHVPAWMYGDYDRILPDLRARSRQLRRKSMPDDRPVPPSFTA